MSEILVCLTCNVLVPDRHAFGNHRKQEHEIYAFVPPVATQVSPPTPPKCERCQQQMTWTATAPVIGAPMEWRCFNHVDVGEVSQGPLVSPPTPEAANQVLTTLTILRERGYLGVSVAEALKIARLPKPCKTCHGRRWVMKSLSTVAAGGIWNEPCPDCSSPPPEPGERT